MRRSVGRIKALHRASDYLTKKSVHIPAIEVIVDVEPSTAVRQAEVTAAKKPALSWPPWSRRKLVRSASR
jgi:hypothetical protein